MTKLNYLALCALFCSSMSFAQEDYMNEIVNEACECLEQISDDLVGSALETQLGLCILNAASPYQKEILADHGLDINNIDVEGEKIGVLIAGQMVSKCTNTLVAVSQRTLATAEVEKETIAMNGTVVSISTDLLIYFSVKNDIGRTEKYYWYSFVQSNTDLIRDYADLKDKNVTIEYHKEEFFDPKIMEYRTLNIIDVLNID